MNSAMGSAMSGTLRVFVYGTLLRGESNHHWLAGARFLGRWQTPARFRLFSLGSYPVLCPGGRQAVAGEVYAVDADGLAALDRLEEYPACYDRIQLSSPFGPVWVYVQHKAPARGRLLRQGRWRDRPPRPTPFRGVARTQGPEE
ncbi:gamma-glutamylcyclotransferase family protein [Isoalcanivorax indicus]|uniref:gamma-glutamylcyclotransferase family protein n=1 Tax=Isoalcanivorax indicus TaxID=2202653 RepID=UPI000DB9B867|nr:gamma-glutamylcyclotransferase family protein [Isoalcanivorax indicus]